jgi:hypothetical protein
MRHRRCCDVTFARPTLWTVIERYADSRRPGNDSGDQAPTNDGGPSLEVGLLAELRAALAEHDIGSELREDLACLAVKTQAPGSCLWVFVSFGGRYFSWNNAELQHPVRDMQGAAHRIAMQVHDTPAGSGQS